MSVTRRDRRDNLVHATLETVVVNDYSSASGGALDVGMDRPAFRVNGDIKNIPLLSIASMYI